MHFPYLISLFPLIALAEIGGHCTGEGILFTTGICIEETTCLESGSGYIYGGCPNDPAGIVCCYDWRKQLHINAHPDRLVLINTESPCGEGSICTWPSFCSMGTVIPGKLYQTDES